MTKGLMKRRLFSALVLSFSLMGIPGQTKHTDLDFRSCRFESIGIIHKEREAHLTRENIVAFDLMSPGFTGQSKVLIDREVKKLRNQLLVLNWLSLGVRRFGKGEIHWTRRICGDSSGFGYAIWLEGLPIWYSEVGGVP